MSRKKEFEQAVKDQRDDQSIATWADPGKGVEGESSN